MIELDPDLRLFSRMSVRRHWRLLLFIAGATTVFVVGAWANGGRGDVFTVVPTTFFLLLTATAPSSSLAALESDGLFDFTRLCGRPPARLLAAMLAGLTWPYVLVAAVLFALQRDRLDAPAIGPELVLLFAAGAVLGMFALAWLPARVNAVGVLGAFVLLSALAVPTLMNHDWIFAYRYDRRTAELTTGAGTQVLPVALAVLAAAPFAIRAASQRLVRPGYRSARAATLFRWLPRLLPSSRPAELLRALRSNLTGAVVLGALFETQMIALIVAQRIHARWLAAEAYPMLMTALPFAAVVIGGLMTMSAASQEVDRGTLDLVRITPQRPETIALGWYLGPTLPMWILALVLVLTFRLGSPASFAAIPASTWWWLTVVSVLAPAVCLADCLHSDIAGSFLASAFACTMLLLLQTAHIEGITRSAQPQLPPWPFNLGVVAPLAFAVVALGAACGRVRRPNGPALAGGAAVAAVVVATAAARIAPPMVYPRFVVAALPVLVPFLFVDRRAGGDAFARVSTSMIAAAVSVTLLSWNANIPIASSMMTGACAALSLGAGILALESAPPRTVVAIAVPAVMALIAFRGTALNELTGRGIAMAPVALRLPDAIVLAAVFALALAARARRWRWRSKRK